MAKYQVTIELTTRLSREVEADSTAQAERFAEAIYEEYLQGDNTHVTNTAHHRSIELLSDAEPRRFRPVGQ